jgi:ABC-type polysaccharide/polyol phosphate transport system ATPase subunit
MPAIRFAGVAKRFTIQHERARSLQDLVVHGWRRRGWREEFWALRDVSVAVAPGEALGVIGANGSGKSTLLKLATRLLTPTQGQVEVHGRVAALLELGAGFHPELTGRDNIYLNASILGIPRRRVDERFADIVAFAGLERFVDTPVKRYSSGMQARLGFAVAVHVDPKILLLDEVLAVGDLQFQDRCLERIRALHEAGCTILLVSHDLEAIVQLCSRVLWLHEGRAQALGAPAEVVSAYREYLLGSPGAAVRGRAPEEDEAAEPSGRRWGSGEVRLVAIELLDGAGRPTRRASTGAPLTVRLRYRAERRVVRPVFGIAFYAGGLQLCGPNTRVDGQAVAAVEGEGEVCYRIGALPLLPGHYSLSAAVYDERELHPFDHHHQSYPFQVASPDGVERYGLVQLAGAWSHEPAPPASAPAASEPAASRTPATPAGTRTTPSPSGRGSG